MAKVKAKADLQTQLFLAGFPTPAREFRFHPTRKWRWDLAWPEHQVAVEIQGAVFTRGRHTRGKGYTEDCCKLAEGQLHGWLVLYVTYQQIDSGQALRWIERALASRDYRVRMGDSSDSPGHRSLDTTRIYAEDNLEGAIRALRRQVVSLLGFDPQNPQNPQK